MDTNPIAGYAMPIELIESYFLYDEFHGFITFPTRFLIE